MKDYGARGDNTADDYAAIVAAYNAIPSDGGTLYFPPGLYRHDTPLAFSAAKTVVIAGAGKDATKLLPNFAAADGLNVSASGCIVTVRDLTVYGYYGPTSDGYYTLNIHDCAQAIVSQVHVLNLQTGGGLKLDSIPAVFVQGLGGRATLRGNWIRVKGCGGMISDSSGIVSTQTSMKDSRPCLHVTNSNSLNVSNCQFGGFGPASTYTVSSIASDASKFTVTTSSAHNFVADDIVVVRGASVSTYNNTWRVATTPTSTTFTVTSTANPGAASGGTAEHLAACVLMSNASGNVNEWVFSNCLFYDTGTPQTYGRADVYLDGLRDGGQLYNIGGGSLTGCYFDGADYGIVAGGSAAANNGGTVVGISVSNGTHSNKTCQLQITAGVNAVTYENVNPSGGVPADDGVDSSAAVRIYGGTSNAKPTGIVLRGQLGTSRFPYSASFTGFKYGVIVDDAGAANPPQDLTITGSQIYGTTKAILFKGGGSTLAARRYTIRNNNVNSGTPPAANTNYIPTIASAATIDLTDYPHDTFRITGSTKVTTINGGWHGRVVRALINDSSFAWGTGGNLLTGSDLTGKGAGRSSLLTYDTNAGGWFVD